MIRAFSKVRLRAWAWAVAVAAAVAIVPAAARAQGEGEASVDVLDVGQGDSILIRSPEGKVALIDTGPPSHAKKLAALLRQKKVQSIDLLVISHHHSDHYGGAIEIIREFRPRVFLASNSSHTTASYLKVLQAVRDEGAKAIAPGEAPRKIGLGTVVLTVFPQPPEDVDDENDNSIGLRMDFGKFSALLTGDSQTNARAFWEKTCPDLLKDCTILKLAHHGSRNGTDLKWLDLTRPEMAVASLGLDNEYGHPHAETIALLAKRKVPLIRTDLDGTASFFSDGRTWDVTTSRRGRDAGGDDELAAGVKGRAQSTRASGKTARTRDERVNKTTATRVDLNNATEDELTTIPGVGPTMAKRIVDGRPYRTVDELLRVKGLGQARIDEIRPHVVVGAKP